MSSSNDLPLLKGARLTPNPFQTQSNQIKVLTVATSLSHSSFCGKHHFVSGKRIRKVFDFETEFEAIWSQDRSIWVTHGCCGVFKLGRHFEGTGGVDIGVRDRHCSRVELKSDSIRESAADRIVPRITPTSRLRIALEISSRSIMNQGARMTCMHCGD